MEVSWEIAVALNSLIDGKPLKGIRFNPVDPKHRESFVSSTVEKMTAHGLIEESGELTQSGEVLKEILKEYKSALSVTFINRMRVGIRYNGLCPSLTPLYENGRLKSIDMRFVSKEALFLEMIELFPFLQQGHKESIARHCGISELKDTVLGHSDNEIFMLANENNRQNVNLIFFLEDDGIKKIDVIHETISEVGGGDIRHELAGMLGLIWM